MERRNFIGTFSFAGLFTFLAPSKVMASGNDSAVNEINQTNDQRVYWYKLLLKIASPVVTNLAEGKLRQNMVMVPSPTYDNRGIDVGYLEAVGRTYAGIAPWLTLPDDNTEEGKQRKKFREQAVKGLDSCFAAGSPDALLFEKQHQPIVDAAYLAQSFLRAPDALWKPLKDSTKKSIIASFKRLRDRKPYNNNWVLFASITEAFIYSVEGQCDEPRLTEGITKIKEWYRGDGWYSDGPKFSFDYYNSYVIHPMMVDTLAVLLKHGKATQEEYDQALKRMQRFGVGLERMISPEGTYPPIGRSIIYRTGSFQILSQLALMHKLPEGIKPAQVRAALTKVKHNMYEAKGVFDNKGWLQLGFAGHYPELADYYSNTGSLYMATLSFLALGLPSTDPFWADPPADWTAKKAWSGQQFPKDYHVDY
ncbi:DUF2264 domain-containing protein [Gynurincola endophyticus]|uniref:DUF2264 domain-containing protein n=1 Tax=Gynurincola endophyticus TaxID=2479004 RepID=UPI000F8E83EA|nr:DUF2264 domain-containing protein [Gynurincola endophyticus]